MPKTNVWLSFCSEMLQQGDSTESVAFDSAVIMSAHQRKKENESEFYVNSPTDSWQLNMSSTNHSRILDRSAF